MKRFLLILITLAGISMMLASAFAQDNREAVLLDIQGAIGPATQDFIHRSFEQAYQRHATLIILRLDTPGGLDKSMRGIVRDIISSPVPVVSYVAPGGARAASAGTYILYASQVAAMAPGTNLGAATPVAVKMPGASSDENKKPSTLEIKAKNDASAYIRSFAEMRGRNVAWAEKAVNEGASLSADEALKLGVIDLIAKDIPELLQKINGRTVSLQSENVVLQTTGLTIQQIEPDWHVKFLNIITDPNIAYILMIIGIWGLFFEFAHPGYVLPGIAGAICLLMALYAFQLLPINYVGLGLILLGMILMVGEAFLPSFGALGIGGVVAFIMGSVMLMGPHTPGYEIALPLIFSVSIVSAGFFLLIVNMAIKARLRPVITGREELIGKTAIVTLDEQGVAWVHTHGELWQVRSERALVAGQKVKIINIEGVRLIVEPFPQ